MKLKKITAALLFAALLVPLAAQDVMLSGDVETSWGAGAPWTNSDSAAGRFTLGNTSFTGKIDAWIDNSSAFAEGTISYDATRTLNSTSTSGTSSGAPGFSLGELWVDYTDSFWGIRIGRQKAAWGAADGITITNVICPDDMSSFAAMTGDDPKLAVDAARFSLSGDTFTADVWWIPFFTPSALPLDEGNTLRRFVVPESVQFPVGGTTLTLPISIGSLEKPETAIWNGEHAFKASGYFSAFDASFYAFYGWDDTPLLDYTVSYTAGGGVTPVPSGITVSGSYERMAMIGADSSIPLGETVLRLETAFFPQRRLQKSAEKIITEKMTAAATAAATGTTPAAVATFEKHNELSALAGIDWMPSGWTITAQYYCDVVFGNLDALDRAAAYTHGATVSVSKTFLDETLEASVSGVIGFNDFDSMISPSVKYSLSDQINVSGGAILFIPGPDKDGKYGAYKDLSTFYASAKFSF